MGQPSSNPANFLASLFISLLIYATFSQNNLYAQRYPIEEILTLLERGHYSSANLLLQTNLELDSTDNESRVLLGTLIAQNGLWREAIQLWQQGLQNKETDYPLLMSIGECYLRQAEALFYRDCVPTSALPLEFASTEYLALADSAIAAFQQALHYYPYESAPLYSLADAYKLRGNYEQALHYAALLAYMFPMEEQHHTLLGKLLIQQKDYSAAEKALAKSLAINPRYTPALKALAEIALAQNNLEKTGQFVKQAAFYDFIPPFIELAYTEKNYEIFSCLSSALAEENKKEGIRQLLLSFINDSTAESTAWLATAIWHQLVPYELEEVIWEEFTLRGKQAQRLIMEMAHHTDNWVLLGKLCQYMVQLQIPGTFDFLVSLLPKDKFAESPLKIAFWLAILGNDLAVPYLVRQLQQKEEVGLYEQGTIAARRRAALALAQFPVHTSLQALQQGLADEEIKPYCAAALYRLTMKEEYLKIICQLAGKGWKNEEVAEFLHLIGTSSAEEVAQLIR
ncbi:MAG: hypothetical protein RMJ44_10585 [Cytophagales bacterium]|nr:hypothetical protein [Bernardetiaceae bacterium]MDW8211520.1 hypothetical protein [Cytophagales bacterium]